MVARILTALLLLGAPAVALEVDVSPGVVGIYRPGASLAGGAGEIGVAVRFDSRFVPELVARGALLGGSLDLSDGIEIGSRFELWRGSTITPYLWGALTHMHETTMDHALSSPGAVLAGVDDGLHHRTGIGLGAGLTWRMLDALPLLANLRVGSNLLWPARDASVTTLAASAGVTLRL